MSKETVLLLGAGASFGAREGLIDPPPPRGRELAQYLLRWLDANDPASPNVTRWPAFARTRDSLIVGPGPWQNNTRRLAEVRAELEQVAAQDQQSDAPHFEALMNRWAKAPTRRAGHRDQFEYTQRLLSYAMNFGHRCAFRAQRDRFDDLLASFSPSVIVTVNYDLLVEQALSRQSIRHSHPGIPGPAGELVSEGTGPIVPMFKLHGSVNWFPSRSGGGGLTVEIADEQARQNVMTPRANEVPHDDKQEPIYSYDTKHTFEPMEGSDLRFCLERDYVPVVAIYGAGKPLLRNLAHVKAHREACSKLLTDGAVGRVLAIGIRPVSKKDDPTLYELTRKLGAMAVEKVYVSPSEEDCREFEALGFSAKRIGLAEYLDGCGRQRDERVSPGPDRGARRRP